MPSSKGGLTSAPHVNATSAPRCFVLVMNLALSAAAYNSQNCTDGSMACNVDDGEDAYLGLLQSRATRLTAASCPAGEKMRFGTFNTNDVSSHFADTWTKITDYQTCHDKGAYLSYMKWEGTVTQADHPRGCYWHRESNKVYFNNDPVGKYNQHVSIIAYSCYDPTPPTTAPTPAPTPAPAPECPSMCRDGSKPMQYRCQKNTQCSGCSECQCESSCTTANRKCEEWSSHLNPNKKKCKTWHIDEHCLGCDIFKPTPDCKTKWCGVNKDWSVHCKNVMCSACPQCDAYKE